MPTKLDSSARLGSTEADKQMVPKMVVVVEGEVEKCSTGRQIKATANSNSIRPSATEYFTDSQFTHSIGAQS